MIDDETTHHTGGDDKLGKARITSYGFGDLLRTPRIRKIMLTMLFVWPVVSMVGAANASARDLALLLAFRFTMAFR